MRVAGDRSSPGRGTSAASGTEQLAEVVRVVAEPERLAILGALVEEPRSPAQLARHLKIPVQRIRRHMSRLAAVGLAAPGGDRRTYHFIPGTLREMARELGPPRDAGLALGAVYEGEEAVLRQYFRGGRLREIPAKQAKRRIVLARLALEFEVGVRYTERQVNEILKRFHEDHAALRRYLVDEDLLSRDGGRYWRSGGPVEL
jgi:hypothetical protein